MDRLGVGDRGHELRHHPWQIPAELVSAICELRRAHRNGPEAAGVRDDRRRNLVRSFRRICEGHKIRLIKVHHLRHTTASLLKKLGVAPRDAQMILGHAHVSTTMQIYMHVDEEARRQALTGLNDLLSTDD